MFKDRLPNRDNNHIRETISYKVFTKSIPSHWIIRDLTERDYGTDVLIEYVTDSGAVTGKLALVQLKYVTDIKFTKKGEFKYYKIKPTTTDYWLSSNIPSYIFFISKNEEMYFVSVMNYVMENYERYAKEDKFYYSIKENDLFSIEKFVDAFEFDISREKNELAFMKAIKSYDAFKDYFMSSYKRDDLMVVDGEQVKIIDRHYMNVHDISKIISIPMTASHIRKVCFENGNCDEIYEFHLSKCLEEISEQWVRVGERMQNIMKHHIIFWANKDMDYVMYMLLISSGDLRKQFYKSLGVKL
ncbi:DUF4365 domain-containing protein [Vibrio sp. Of14-4]|uniref:DUF4365 domain-containing protein n=1 Tax=Vibrio sp. Of14-4 TaxID=2724878 RepID=UPI001EF1C1E6|nr:DUF4365 domain-containing protein [Vibrio sp. Of14-4]MCG7491723.1 DUF4365 domain-containing protein [Vibrio sp. Of14-4]